ncbi:pendrin-like [Lissotriton helveticus]
MFFKKPNSERNAITIEYQLLRKLLIVAYSSRETRHIHWCSKKRCMSFLTAVFPFIGWIPKYKFSEALLGDVLAGVNAGLAFVPQGLTVALLAQTFPLYSVFSLFFASVVYLFLGTSGHVAIGSFSILNVMMSELLQNLNTGQMFNTTNLDLSSVNSRRLLLLLVSLF